MYNKFRSLKQFQEQINCIIEKDKDGNCGVLDAEDNFWLFIIHNKLVKALNLLLDNLNTYDCEVVCNGNIMEYFHKRSIILKVSTITNNSSRDFNFLDSSTWYRQIKRLKYND